MTKTNSVVIQTGSVFKTESVFLNGGQTLSPQSELGKTLLAIRQRAIAKVMKLQTVDEILEEIRHDRAGTGEEQDDSVFETESV